MKSRFTIRSLEDLGRYVAGESIPVAVELEGIPRDCIRVEYSAECIDAGGEQQWDISQVELDETGHGKDDWTVHTGEVGRYLIEVRMTDGSGLTQAQQVLIEVVVPDGPSQAAADSAAEAPKSQGGGPEGQGSGCRDVDWCGSAPG